MLKVIEHHSASAGNTFIDCPQMWIIEKIYGFETEENARMKMGHAAEETAHDALANQITDENINTLWNTMVVMMMMNVDGPKK